MQIRSWFGGLLALALPLAVVAEEPPSGDEIRRAIVELDSDDYFTREAATRRLWRAGPDAAGDALREATETGNPEVAFRARKVLWNFRHGIVPGTPPDVVALIERFRTGNANTRVEVFKELAERSLTQPMAALLRSETNEQVRRKLVQVVTPIVGGKLPELVASGRFDEAERWFELSVFVNQDGDAERDYAVYLLLHGGLADRIAEQRGIVAEAATPEAHRRLAHLLLVAGDVEAARVHAGQADDDRLRTELALRAGDWAAIAEPTEAPGDPGVEKLGFRMAFLQLAGRREAADAVAAELVQLAENEPHRAWTCGEALMIAERWDTALEVFRAHDVQSAFELLSARQRYREAFELIGLDPSGENAVAWFRERVEKAEGNEQKIFAEVVWSTRLARELYRTRGREAVRELLSAVRDVAHEQDVKWLNTLAKIEAELGLDEEARRDAAAVLGADAENERLDPLNTIFDDHAREARVWWRFRRAMEQDEPALDALAWIAAILATAREPAIERDAFRNTVATAEEMAAEFPNPQRGEWLRAFAETALLREDLETAGRLFEASGEFAPSAEPVLRRGDVARLAEDFSAAADWYRKAWERGREDPLPLYLSGLMLVRNGQVDEGRKLVELARLAPLADASLRKNLADGLSERGFDAEARTEWEFVIRTASHATWEGEDAWSLQISFARLANAIREEDGVRASDHWRRYLLYLLKTNASFQTDLRRYVVFAHIVHRVRAIGLAKTDRLDEALAAADRALEAWPGEIEIVLQLVPILDGGQRTDRADQLFERVYAFNADLCEAFPDGGHLHNEIAWLAAKCRRRLDDALAHANRAVALEPENAAFLDTLAEVHFQRGERDRAVELARKCVEMDPDGEHYRAQLERFTTAER